MMKTAAFQVIQDFLLNKINPSFIVEFGSYGKGNPHQNSDIDIAFYSEDVKLTSYDLFIIAQELADILKIEVDLVNLRSASTVFKSQIFTTGIIIYSENDTLVQIQQMTALSMYAKLNEERQEILKNISESGCIYENDVILNKISTIERCIQRIQEVY